MSVDTNILKLDKMPDLKSIGVNISWLEFFGEIWKIGRKAFQGYSNEGMYDVLQLESILTICDPKGKIAQVNKHQKVRYMQNNIIAFQDLAWGDGKILLNYKCSPGFPCDTYRLGQYTYILISLHDVKQKDDIDDFNIEWVCQDTFLSDTEYWGTTINHRTKILKIKVILPASRPPINAYLIVNKKRIHKLLNDENRIQLADGRWLLKWECEKPRLYSNYLLMWQW